MKLSNNLRQKTLNLLILMFAMVALNGQQGSDILQSAQQLVSQKNFLEASKLLAKHYPSHKQDLYTSWLYAASLYEIGDVNKAKAIYQLVIKNYPKNNDVKVDFATKLMNNNELDLAQWYFESMKNISSDNVFIVNKSLAQINYWNGAYDDAYNYIVNATKTYPTDKSLLSLKDKITTARSNWLKVEAGYFTDDQPLSTILPSIASGFYLNQNIAVGVSADLPFYDQDTTSYNSQWIQGFLKYQLLDYKTSIQLDAGIVRLPSTSYDWTGKLSITNKVWQHLNLGIYAGRQAYLATISSLNKNLLPYSYGVNFEWNDPKGFIGKASWDINNFSTLNNMIQTQSAWVVSPEVKAGIVDMRIGYGINYSNTTKNNFESTINLDDIITEWDTTTVIAGIYQPFYSPNHQLIHSAIGMITMHPASNIQVGVNVNYGFYATADTPYLFLNKDELEGQNIIDRKFFNRKYHPIDFDVYALYNMSSTMSLKANYKYQKTNYYESHYTGVTANILF